MQDPAPPGAAPQNHRQNRARHAIAEPSVCRNLRHADERSVPRHCGPRRRAADPRCRDPAAPFDLRAGDLCLSRHPVPVRRGHRRAADPAARHYAEHLDHRRACRDAAGAPARRDLRPLPLDPCAEFGAERDLRRDLWCRQQPAAADRRAVSARPARSDPADAGRRRLVDAARRLSALSHVRYARLPGQRHLAARGCRGRGDPCRRCRRPARRAPRRRPPRRHRRQLAQDPDVGLWRRLYRQCLALTMFGIGLLIRGYAMPVAGIDIAKLYVPHGAMVGAGLVALIQVALLIARRGTGDAVAAATDDTRIRQALGLGIIGYIAIAVLIAVMGGLIAELSPGMLIAFVVYAAFAAFVPELIVGISAMHAGWFPAFAVALITLIMRSLLGVPPVARAFLIWSIPLAIVQGRDGPSGRLGVRLAPGLPIPNPMGGWAVLVGIAIRTLVLRWKGKEATGSMEVLAAGFIGGDALFGFFDSVIKTVPKAK